MVVVARWLYPSTAEQFHPYKLRYDTAITFPFIRFEWETAPDGRAIITAIRPVHTCRCDELARLLFDCVPAEWRWFGGAGDLITEFIDFLESPVGLNLPVQITSVGPTLADKVTRVTIPTLQTA